MEGTSYRKYMGDGFIATFVKFNIVWGGRGGGGGGGHSLVYKYESSHQNVA